MTRRRAGAGLMHWRRPWLVSARFLKVTLLGGMGRAHESLPIIRPGKSWSSRWEGRERGFEGGKRLACAPIGFFVLTRRRLVENCACSTGNVADLSRRRRGSISAWNFENLGRHCIAQQLCFPCAQILQHLIHCAFPPFIPSAFHSAFPQGTEFVIDPRYEVTRRLGNGAYGVVVAAKDTVTGKAVSRKRREKDRGRQGGRRKRRSVTTVRESSCPQNSLLIGLGSPDIPPSFLCSQHSSGGD